MRFLAPAVEISMILAMAVIMVNLLYYGAICGCSGSGNYGAMSITAASYSGSIY